MAKHKAPTQITIASIQEQTVFHEFVDRYWKAGLVVAVIVSVAILIPTYAGMKARAANDGTWDELRSQAELGGGLMSAVKGGPPEALALFAEQHKDSSVGAWAKALQIGSEIEADKLSAAQKSAEQLASMWPGHLLTTGKVFPGGDGVVHTLPDAVRSGNAALQAWEKEHAFLFTNPELPSDAPRVRLDTSKGVIVVGLYVDRAPKHAQNFLEQARKGSYVGTKFHRVVRGSLIQGGDPNSVSGEPDSWGKGGSETTLEPENDPRLHHFKGALAAWKAPGEVRSNASQFFITTANQNQMDGQYVVFGRVLEGEAVLEAIESGAVVGDRPQDPVVIQTVEVLGG